MFLIFIAVCCTTVESEKAHNALGRGIQLPQFNILGELDETGTTVFAELPEYCFQASQQPITKREFTYYKNTETFYSIMSTSAKVDASLQGDYSMGFTLDTSTKAVSGSSRNISGTSLIIMASTNKILLNADCYRRAEFDGRFMEDLNNLPRHIEKPAQRSSWRLYERFLTTYGSHVVSGVFFGSKINQMAFAESSMSYSERDFEVRSCVNLAAPSDVGKLGLSMCANVSKQESHEATGYTMTDTLVLTGGTSETRNKLTNTRTPELMEKFMDEAYASKFPIRYTFKPIWEIIQTAFSGSSDYYIRGVNLESYYLGYLNYGCEHTYSGDQELQRFDLTPESTPDYPQYECTLAPKGCHNHDDCHYKPIWCACRGITCVMYKDVTLSTDKIKKVAYANTDKDIGWSGCTWRIAGSKCHCGDPNQERPVVWKIDFKDAVYATHSNSMAGDSVKREDL